MKVNKLFLVMVVAIATLMAGCSPEPIKVVPEIRCNNQECDVLITSHHRKETEYTVTVSQENEGTPIGERLRFPETTSARHDYWYYAGERIYQLTETIQPGETLSHNFEMSYGTGQVLIIAHVRTPPTSVFRTNYGNSTDYGIVEFPGKDNPIKNTLSCRVNGKVVARTIIEEGSGIGTRTMGLYINGNLEEPVATFVVHEGHVTQISYDVPEGTYLVELDVFGHHEKNYKKEIVADYHVYRTYCTP